MADFADVIIDISHDKVDRPFTYSVPDELKGKIETGCPVIVPFGNAKAFRRGYVVGMKNSTDLDTAKIKMIADIAKSEVNAQDSLIELAAEIHSHYGCTMNQALLTVLPVKEKIKQTTDGTITYADTKMPLSEAIKECEKKHHSAKLRVLTALDKNPVIGYRQSIRDCKVTSAVLKTMQSEGRIKINISSSYRTPESMYHEEEKQIVLNDEQKRATEIFSEDFSSGKHSSYLLFGVTGSGKTQVYIEMIKTVTAAGKQVIFMIPEINMTYQTIGRLLAAFGNHVAVIHSKLSKGERYDQFRRIIDGDANIIVGPRSAVFAPFNNPGLIILDEEHDNAYKNDSIPRYNTKYIALLRAKISGASVVFGSATPSPGTYKDAIEGRIKLLMLSKRAVNGSNPATVKTIDMREELKSGNRSIFSRDLRKRIKESLKRKEQVILFINRRGYSNFVSCRACGEAIKCIHCDVTMTLHNNSVLRCHYCGYSIPMPKHCPSCDSPYIAGFGTGTEKLEAETKREFFPARVLRMDTDITVRKHSADDILRTFSEKKADILIGTQMVVKGHDFPGVTTVGIMAADTSLYVNSYDSAQRTFELLTQAAGRAGRGELPGEVIIQTYRPDHYAIVAAAQQNYTMYYNNEIGFRKISDYPPCCHIWTIQLSSKDENILKRHSEELAGKLRKTASQEDATVLGPAQASVYKVHDYYRNLIYIKHKSYDILLKIKNRIEAETDSAKDVGIVFSMYDFT